MTSARILSRLLRSIKLPFPIDDIEDIDVSSGLITLRNDEHPYIIRIEKLPIESDYKEEKQFFWRDLSGRGFTETFTAEELLDSFPELMLPNEYDEDNEDAVNETGFKNWVETCEIGEEYDSGTPNEIKRIK